MEQLEQNIFAPNVYSGAAAVPRGCKCGRLSCRVGQRNCRKCHAEAQKRYRLRQAQDAAAFRRMVANVDKSNDNPLRAGYDSDTQNATVPLPVAVD
jgi:hypothetical protein